MVATCNHLRSGQPTRCAAYILCVSATCCAAVHCDPSCLRKHTPARSPLRQHQVSKSRHQWVRPQSRDVLAACNWGVLFKSDVARTIKSRSAAMSTPLTGGVQPNVDQALTRGELVSCKWQVSRTAERGVYDCLPPCLPLCHLRSQVPACSRGVASGPHRAAREVQPRPRHGHRVRAERGATSAQL